MDKNGSDMSLTLYPSGSVEKGKIPDKFVFCEVKENETVQWRNRDLFRILFLRKGNGQIRMQEKNSIHLNEKECLLIGNAEFLAYASCELVIWTLDEWLDPGDRTFLRTLQPQVITHPFFSLPVAMQPSIEDFLNLLFLYKQEGLIEQDTLFELKQRELFLLFRHYYDPEDLAALFYPLLCRLNGFREQILEHFHQVKNTGELIQRLGMKRTSFERKFRRYFGTSAHQWLLQQKAIAVRNSLQEGRYSLHEIRKMYDFNSATHFVRFCRRQLGAPPSQLRQASLEGKTKN